MRSLQAPRQVLDIEVAGGGGQGLQMPVTAPARSLWFCS